MFLILKTFYTWHIWHSWNTYIFHQHMWYIASSKTTQVLSSQPECWKSDTIIHPDILTNKCKCIKYLLHDWGQMGHLRILLLPCCVHHYIETLSSLLIFSNNATPAFRPFQIVTQFVLQIHLWNEDHSSYPNVCRTPMSGNQPNSHQSLLYQASIKLMCCHAS